MDTNVSNCPIHGGRIRGIRFGEVPRIVYGCLWRHLLGHVVAHLALATAAPKAPSRWEAAEQEESPRAYIKAVNATVLQQESKVLTRVRSQIRVPAISSSRAGPAYRFNGHDERCIAFILFAHPAGLMTQGPGAAGALVAVDFHLAQSMIAHGLGGSAVAVQEGLPAVAASPGVRR
jgi:hypothetical protein